MSVVAVVPRRALSLAVGPAGPGALPPLAFRRAAAMAAAAARIGGAATHASLRLRRAVHVLRVLAARDADALWEWLLGSLVVAGITWGSLAAWRFYDAALRPHARAAPVVVQPRSAHLSDADEVRRMQRATDLVGEATAYVDAKRWDWARAAVEQALALDPDYPEAKALLRRLIDEPPPALTPQEQATRDRDDRVIELLGAAASYREAGRPDLARPLLEQALALDPASPLVRAVIEQLDADAGEH